MQIRTLFLVVAVMATAGCQSVPDKQLVASWVQEGYHYRDGTQDLKQDYVKSFEFFSKAANTGDADAQANLAWLYQTGNGIEKDDKRAFALYKKAALQGDKYAKGLYAQYLINGNGGEVDIQKAMSIYRAELDNKNYSFFSSYRDGLLEAAGIYSLNVGVVQPLYWEEYFAKNNVEGKIRSCNNRCPCDYISITPGSMYSAIGDNYIDEFHRWAPDFKVTSDDEEKMLSTALRYYALAGNLQKISEIILKVTRPKYGGKVDPTLPSICRSVFSHADEDYQLFNQAQLQIFQQPGRADKILQNYKQTMQAKYPAKSDDDLVSFDFHTISVETVVQIILDFMDGKFQETEVKVEDSASALKLMAWIKAEHPELVINLLLKSNGLKASCAKGKLHIFSLAQMSETRFFTNALITKWSDSVKYTDSLNGGGEISFQDNFNFDGDIKNNLPNGSGKYVEGDSFFEGDGFRNGVLTGHGYYGSGKEINFQGDFVQNVLDGNGKLAMGYSSIYDAGYIYEGGLKEDKPEGKGHITYVAYDDTPRKYYLPVDNRYPPLWSYEGEFADGTMHGKGKCELYRDRKVVDRFSCEFYKNYLIKVGDILLLPEGADFSTHFDNNQTGL